MDKIREAIKRMKPGDCDADYLMFLNNLTPEQINSEKYALDNPSVSSPLKRKREEDLCSENVDKKKAAEPATSKQLSFEEKGKKMDVLEDSQDEDMGEFGLSASEGEPLRNIFRAYEEKLPPFDSNTPEDNMDVDGTLEAHSRRHGTVGQVLFMNL